MRETEAPQQVAFVEVSPEMTLLLGCGPIGDAACPPDPIALTFSAEEETPALKIEPTPHHSIIEHGELTLMVSRSAFLRVGGVLTTEPGGQSFHLPSELRAIVAAIRSCTLNGETRQVYRLGKSIELLCETIRLQAADELVAFICESALSLQDTRRIMNARRIIDERWNEKLTLDLIARACGLNRAKLTRGFREVFSCTIAEALAEQRLSQARLMLRTTDLPVSSVGYENGYLNNASFARAFSRRFGLSPSDFRACGAAA